jgi:diacylglycerol kinase (ATP)
VSEARVRPAAFVLFNRHARGGQAGGLWERIRGYVAERFDLSVTDSGSPEFNLHAVRCALEAGTHTFLAAGGDGTVNALLNALVVSKGSRPLSGVVLGAVGLGSSNDFHKPYGELVGGVPCLIDWAHARPRDVALATIAAQGGETTRRCFIVSASLGVTAEGNAFFNRGDLVLRPLKRWWPAAAMAYAAMQSILRHRNGEATVTVDGVSERAWITNLSVLKTPFLSGSLRFDTPVLSDDGLLAVNLCAGMARLGAVRALVDLARGRFAGRPHCRHWRATRADVELAEERTLELDGEITSASSVSFEILPERIPVCA